MQRAFRLLFCCLLLSPFLHAQDLPSIPDSLLNLSDQDDNYLINFPDTDSIANLEPVEDILNISASDSLLNLEPVDSLKGIIGDIESGIRSVQDSLSRATQVPDSLLPRNLIAPLTQKIDSSNLKVNTFADSLKSKVQLPDSLKSLIPEDANFLNDRDIPGLDLKPLEEVKEIDGLKGIEEIKAFEKVDELKELGNTDPLKEIKQLKEIEEIETITEKAGELKEISRKTEDIAGSAENEVKNLKGIKALEEQKGKLDNYKKDFGGFDQVEAEEFYKERAMNTGRELAKNHFAGQADKLRAAQTKLAELKRKYPEGISSIKNLPNRFSNAMRGKPFKERFLMGLTVQVLPDQTPNIDLSPFVAYKISGRWSAGVGGSYRLVPRENWRGLNQRGTVYGFRAISEFKLYKGFFAHVDYEQMKVSLSDSLLGKQQGELSKRGWVDGLMIGMGKDYRIAKYVKGNMQVLYNFLHERNSPYKDKVMIRFGFSFQLNDKIKKPKITDTEAKKLKKEARKRGKDKAEELWKKAEKLPYK